MTQCQVSFRFLRVPPRARVQRGSSLRHALLPQQTRKLEILIPSFVVRASRAPPSIRSTSSSSNSTTRSGPHYMFLDPSAAGGSTSDAWLSAAIDDQQRLSLHVASRRIRKDARFQRVRPRAVDLLAAEPGPQLCQAFSKKDGNQRGDEPEHHLFERVRIPVGREFVHVPMMYGMNDTTTGPPPTFECRYRYRISLGGPVPDAMDDCVSHARGQNAVARNLGR